MRQKTNILLTGSAGFIGRNLRPYLTDVLSTAVLPVDLDTGYDLSCPGWTHSIPVDEADVVIYLAQSLMYHEFPEGAADMFAVNTSGAVELAEWACQHGVRRFLYASTGNVYTPGRTRFTEEDECQPRTMYGATKYSAELLLRPYSSLFQVILLRPFGVYGPGQNRMLVHDMIQRVETGAEIRLAGGAGIYLTPLFIDDAVESIAALVEAALPTSLLTLNLAGDETLNLGEMVGQMGAALGKEPVTRLTDGKPEWFCGDNSRLKHYHARFVPFKEGLRRTLVPARG